MAANIRSSDRPRLVCVQNVPILHSSSRFLMRVAGWDFKPNKKDFAPNLNKRTQSSPRNSNLFFRWFVRIMQSFSLWHILLSGDRKCLVWFARGFRQIPLFFPVSCILFQTKVGFCVKKTNWCIVSRLGGLTDVTFSISPWFLVPDPKTPLHPRNIAPRHDRIWTVLFEWFIYSSGETWPAQYGHYYPSDVISSDRNKLAAFILQHKYAQRAICNWPDPLNQAIANRICDRL